MGIAAVVLLLAVERPDELEDEPPPDDKDEDTELDDVQALRTWGSWNTCPLFRNNPLAAPTPRGESAVA